MPPLDDVAVRALVDAAEHESVTAELLTGGNRYTQFSLYDDPVVAYLRADEQPHYMFFNEMKGVGIGDKRETITPDSAGLTVMTITDQRTLVLVGQEDGDKQFDIGHESVTGVEYSTGLLKHRLVLRTTETTYHLWIDSSYDESALEQATNALRRYRESATTNTTGPATTNATTASEPATTTATNATNTPPTSAPGADSNGTDEDPLETLERLAELHEAGVLSDEEFTSKKQELLEQI